MKENLKIVTIRLSENLTIPGYQRPYRRSTESAVTLVTVMKRPLSSKI